MAPADEQAFPLPPTPYLEPAAKKLTENTDPHPRIYEIPPNRGAKFSLICRAVKVCNDLISTKNG